MTPIHDDCPLGDGGYTKIMTKLEHLETLLVERAETNERRFKTLEDHDARNLLIAAVFMGIAMVVKLG